MIHGDMYKKILEIVISLVGINALKKNGNLNKW